jgi:hypothetical protein
MCAAILLRLGSNELAETVWTQYTRGSSASTSSTPQDPYLDIAYSWRHALENEAWDAHMSGNDRLALSAVRLLVRSCDAIDAEARRQGVAPYRKLTNDGQPFRFLEKDDPVRALLVDQEQRALKRSRDRSPAISLKTSGSLLQFWNAVQARLCQCPNQDA